MVGVMGEPTVPEMVVMLDVKVLSLMVPLR
jgi:hypothetical protein